MYRFILIFLFFTPFSFAQNWCLYFDGGDWLQNLNAYRTSDTQGTFAFWVKLDSPDNFDRFITIHRALNSSNYLYFRVSTSKVQIVVNYSGTTHAISGGTTLSSGTWYHIIVKSDNSDYTIKVNNNLEELTVGVGSNTGDWLDAFVNENFLIGAHRSASPPLNRIQAYFDEIYYFSAPTTEAQDAELYNNGTPKTITLIDNLIDHWSFEEGAGTITTSDGSGALVLTLGDGSTPTTYPTWTNQSAAGLGWDTGTTTCKFPGWSGFGGW